MIDKKTIQILCYLGVFPFYILIGINYFYQSFTVIELFNLYSIIILCFLCGSTWTNLILIRKELNLKFLKIIIVWVPIVLIAIDVIVSSLSIKIFFYATIYFLIYWIDNKFLMN